MAGTSLSFRPPETPMVRSIIGLLLGAYFVEVLMTAFAPALADSVLRWVVLIHQEVWAGHVWTLATYGLIHDVGAAPIVDLAVTIAFIAGLLALFRSEFGRREPGVSFIAMFAGSMLLGNLGYGAPFHVLGNALVFWFFGPEFERRWGGARFARYALAGVVGGAVLSALVWLVLPSLTGAVVLGASGAALALITAFAVYFPDASVMYGFAIPIKGKHLLVIAFLFDIVSVIGRGNVAIVVHAGGAITGYLLCTGYWRPSKLRERFGAGRGGGKPPPRLRVVKGGQNGWIQ